MVGVHRPVVLPSRHPQHLLPPAAEQALQLRFAAVKNITDDPNARGRQPLLALFAHSGNHTDFQGRQKRGFLAGRHNRKTARFAGLARYGGHQLVCGDAEGGRDLQVVPDALLERAHAVLDLRRGLEAAGPEIQIAFIDGVALHDWRQRLAPVEHLAGLLAVDPGGVR